jgi:hypothetical protein
VRNSMHVCTVPNKPHDTAQPIFVSSVMLLPQFIIFIRLQTSTINDNMTSFETVHAVLSPFDASKLSGRYETAVDVKGKCRTDARCLNLPGFC